MTNEYTGHSHCDRWIRETLASYGVPTDCLSQDDIEALLEHVGQLIAGCDGRSENVARAGGRRSARKRGAHGLTHGHGGTMEVSLTPSRPLSREVYGCTPTWRTGPRSAAASSSTA